MILDSSGSELGHVDSNTVGTNELNTFSKQWELYWDRLTELYIINSTSHLLFLKGNWQQQVSFSIQTLIQQNVFRMVGFIMHSGTDPLLMLMSLAALKSTELHQFTDQGLCLHRAIQSRKVSHKTKVLSISGY